MAKLVMVRYRLPHTDGSGKDHEPGSSERVHEELARGLASYGIVEIIEDAADGVETGQVPEPAAKKRIVRRQ